MHKRFLPVSCATLLASCFVLIGCDRTTSQQPAGPAATGQQPASLASPALSKAKIAINEAARQPRSEVMQASQETMTALLADKHEEIAPIKFNDDHRLGIHPGRGVSSWVEFDTSSLKTVELFPMVRLNAECRAKPEAGVVGVTIYSDGEVAGQRLLIDRDYRPGLTIELGGTKRLKIEVDQGNDRISCDWFSLGFGAISK